MHSIIPFWRFIQHIGVLKALRNPAVRKPVLPIYPSIFQRHLKMKPCSHLHGMKALSLPFGVSYEETEGDRQTTVVQCLA